MEMNVDVHERYSCILKISLIVLPTGTIADLTPKACSIRRAGFLLCDR
ncbi:hypothetical protein [Paenibacillus hunanensis]|uniref:Uncharacterized protein n=1 Tax=Paenibacillus hunanensis TaxID=539262 RepID=A0ABU1J048_9BACL|nr:hypothetical protein [Paenibacillus hunanensis]MCL9661573.1 hypothetical protein [Paenibacillus hunanensis]MDR6244878.1 hypothetical protein [Paenibacillus hunanensis]